MNTRKHKRGGKPPLWAGPAAYFVPTARPALAPIAPGIPTTAPQKVIKPTLNAWKLHQMRLNKTRRNEQKTSNNSNNSYGEVWPVNTSKWNIPVGNKKTNKNRSMKEFNKPTLTNAERKKYHTAWNAYFNKTN